MTKYHFIGIGGIGMSALADLLLEKKNAISGSDLNLGEIATKLEKRGATILKGQKAEHISGDQIVVYSSAVKESNPEYQQATKLGCQIIHRSELLAMLASGKTSIAIAGTHGKTTISSLLSSVLLGAGCDPSFAIGGLLEGENGRNGKSDLFVLEADESDGSFLRYHPTYAIISNVEPEHLDHYGNKEALEKAFDSFASQVEDLLFYCGDTLCFKKGISYGFGNNCNLQITNWRQEGWHLIFDCTFEGKTYTKIEVALIGKHNVRNSAAVFALALKLGLDEAAIRKGLQNFPGVARRCQLKKEEHAITFLDDYAHHPTEVSTTLDGIAQVGAGRRIVVLFQPHRYSRTASHFDDFAKAFGAVDHLFISDIYAAGEQNLTNVTGEALAIAAGGSYLPKERWSELKDFLRPHDIFVTMGAGDVTYFTCHPTTKYRVGFVYGGASCEHEISKKTAAMALEAIDRSLYDIEKFYISRDGKWNDNPLLSTATVESLSKCDLYLPILHGTHGEDGTIQGFFELLQKPYIGPDWTACAIAMDKHRSKMLASAAGVRIPKGFAFTKGEWRCNSAKIIAQAADLTFPLFVKANHLGSSLGTSKIYSPEELKKAIEFSFEGDHEVLIEEGIEKCREFEFAVMGNDLIEVPTPGEKLAGGAFVDYKMKYTKGLLESTVTPQMDPTVLEEGRALAKKVYQAIGSTGFSRVDFLLDTENQWWFFELNSIPGMQPLSLFPRVWNHRGVSYQKMLDKMIILALERSRAWAC